MFRVHPRVIFNCSSFKVLSIASRHELSVGSFSGAKKSPPVEGPAEFKQPRFAQFEDFAQDVPPVEAAKQNKVVIFDKDGTLICFHSMWTPWALETAAKIETASGLRNLDIANAVYDLLGFCPKEQKVKPGLLAESTMPEIRAKLIELLIIHGMEGHEAEEVVSSVWQNCDTSSGNTLKTLHNLKTLFQSLKEHGFKVAICTADSRDGTEGALEKLGLLDLVDIVVCGDDKGTKPKPNPDNAWAICKALDVDPENAYMVGDTIADVGMGKWANLGGSIGVLSGVATERELGPLATHLIPDVGSVLSVIQAKEKKAKGDVSPSSLPSARKDAAGARKVREYLEKYGGHRTEEIDLAAKIVSSPKDEWAKSDPMGKYRQGSK